MIDVCKMLVNATADKESSSLTTPPTDDSEIFEVVKLRGDRLVRGDTVCGFGRRLKCIGIAHS